MTDERSTASRIPDPGIRALYKLENRWQAWLDVEAALARDWHGTAYAMSRSKQVTRRVAGKDTGPTM